MLALNKTLRPIVRLFVETTVIFAVVLFILYMTLPDKWYLVGHNGDTGYARRWDGSCSGWTQRLTIIHTVGDLMIAHVYLGIALAIRRFHPTMRRIRSSKLTVFLITTIFLTCAAGHIGEAYTNFYSVYPITGFLKIIYAIVGGIGLTFIADNLLRVKHIVEKETDAIIEHDKKMVRR